MIKYDSYTEAAALKAHNREIPQAIHEKTKLYISFDFHNPKQSKRSDLLFTCLTDIKYPVLISSYKLTFLLISSTIGAASPGLRIIAWPQQFRFYVRCKRHR